MTIHAIRDTAAKVVQAKDSLINFMSGLGVPGRDKAAKGASFFHYLPLTQFEIESAYRANWLARKLIDIPAQDATRAWRVWQTDTNTVEKLEAEEIRLDVQVTLKNAIVMSRLYGGAALILGVNQGKASTPLDLEKVGKGDLDFVVAASRHALGYGPIIKDVMDPNYGKPEFFTRNQNVHDNPAVKPAEEFRIHPSRVVMLKGMTTPDPIQSGEIWGDSILQNVLDAVQHATMVTQSVATLVSEAKFDIIKIPDLTQNISTAEYQNALTARFMFANSMKSIINTLILDKEEEWDRVAANFTTLPDVLQMYLLIVSGAADIPATRMLGQSPAGLQSTGESDVRNYYDRVNSDQVNVLSPALAALDDVLIRSAVGSRDPSLYYVWNPLWQMSAPEKAAVAKLKADAFAVDVNTAVLDSEALRIGRQNQLIEDEVYPGLEQALEEQEQLDLESMISKEEQEAQEEAELRKQMAMGLAQNGPPGQQKANGGKPQGGKPNGGFPAKDARPSSLARRMKLRRHRVRLGGLPVQPRDEWREEDHPRGQPDNAGKFGPGGGGAAPESKTGATAKAVQAAEAKSGAKKTDIAQNMAGEYGEVNQTITDLDELYAASKKAEPNFQKTVEAFAQKHGGKVMYQPADSAEPGTRMKNRKSAERKLKDELNGDVTQLRDVIRATVVFDDVADTRVAAADFIANNDVVRVKDRYLTPMGGYRDLMLNYRTPEGLVVEVQFNSVRLLEAKFGKGHKMYERIRVLKADKASHANAAEIEDLLMQSEELYNTAYVADGDGCGWQRDC